MQTIYDRLDQIIPIMENQKFLKGTGLGNEINFRIFDYDPEDELIVRDGIKKIEKYFNRSSSSLKIIEFDLYEMLIEILKEEEVFDGLFDFEREEGHKEFENALKAIAQPEMFIKKIKKESEDYNTIFISGVGKIFPIIRAHSILNNLHEVLENKPLVLFFPGIYDSMALTLFGKIKDDNYYRAFKLVDRK